MNRKIKNSVAFALFGLLSISQAFAQDFGELQSELSGLRTPVKMTLSIIVGIYALVGLVGVFMKYNNGEEREAKKGLIQVVVSLVIWLIAQPLINAFIPA